jgi:hypothetical protein
MAIFPISDQYKYLGKGPLDAKSLVKTYAELTSLNTWTVDSQFIAYNGMIVAVWLNKADASKNGIYFLFDASITSPLGKPDVTNEANWHKLAEVSEVDLEGKLLELETRVTALEEAESSVVTYGYRNLFPSIGEPNKLYIAADEQKTYAWINNQYYTVGGGEVEAPDIICGGSAETE